MDNQRIMGIDYGDVRTGIAVSDTLGIMTSGVGTFTAYNDDRLLEIVLVEIKKWNPGEIIIGNPINMNGTVGPRSEKVRAFGERLSVLCGLPVIYVDERMSTMEAHRYLNISDTRGKKRKGVVDTLSAEIILQSYLDSRQRKS